MVEETATDGTRIAELLASELEGLSVGSLGAVSVVEAVPDAAPSAAGTYAYGIECRGQRIGEVRIRPAEAVLVLTEDRGGVAPPDDRDGLSVEDGDLVIESGAAVKRAVDALRRRLGD
jgi:hypothetical protein